MENKKKLSFRMDLSKMPADIISYTSKYLLMSSNDDKFKINKIFRKKNDNNLLKFFFCLDGDIFRYQISQR